MNSLGSIRTRTLSDKREGNMEKVKKSKEKLTWNCFIGYFSAALKEKRPFRRNGLTSNDCLPYEILRIIFFVDLSAFAG
jgi:hypothetical protein